MADKRAARMPSIPRRLTHQSVFPEAEVMSVSDNNVIENLNAEYLTGLYEPSGQQRILLTRLCIAARMIMHKDNGRGGFTDSHGEGVPWVNKRGGKAPNGNEFVPNALVLGVEERTPEDLLFQVFHPRPVVIGNVLTRRERDPRETRLLISPPEFYCRLDFRRFCRPDAGYTAYFRYPGLFDPRKSSEAFQELAAEINSTASGLAVPYNNGEQLSISEDCGPVREQPFPGPLFFRPVFHAFQFSP